MSANLQPCQNHHFSSLGPVSLVAAHASGGGGGALAIEREAFVAHVDKPIIAHDVLLHMICRQSPYLLA